MSERANPFDLSDFAPAPAKPKTDRAVIDQVAEAYGFPSRQPTKPSEVAAPDVQPAPAVQPKRQQRRYTTGRNKQINIKATDETIQRLYRLADDRGVPLGELLEQALDALEKSSA